MFRNRMIWILVAGWILSACTSSQSTDSASPSPQPASSTESFSSPSALLIPTLLPEEQPPARAQSEFTTDFSKHIVPYSEILSGGPPKTRNSVGFVVSWGATQLLGNLYCLSFLHHVDKR
jgi:hypothetical protein